jgi:hypothetical protein
MGEEIHSTERQVDADASQLPEQEPDHRLRTQRQVINLLGSLTAGLTSSLAELDDPNHGTRINLAPPGKLLLCLGGVVIIVSVCLRVVPAFFLKLESYDFIALLGVGCLIEFMGSFLFIYQYRAEQAKTTAVVKTTERVTEGLVAVLGTERD